MMLARETNTHTKYIGEELELFQLAHRWKRYFASRMQEFMSGDVLEVGSGKGANIPFLHRDDLTRWVSLEPDRRLCEDYQSQLADGHIPSHCELVQGTLEALSPEERFDSIVYIDVLEHIEDDRREFERAMGLLRAGGNLLVLCPAHNFLFSPFDRAIGHFRRYNKRKYRALSDQAPLRLEYLDSVGMMASLANRMLLRQSYPSEKQIRIWDKYLVRLSLSVDPITLHMLGKSILGVWKK